jgi:hypothetical protein
VENKSIKWLAWDKMPYPKSLGGMGFRDLHLFNMAMVAKQGWNFMMKPNTLVARIYKARYFPKSTIFESHLGNNPSFAWRSIWKSRKVLMNGCRWKIGNGIKIKVMGQPWLREEDGRWMQAPQSQGVYDITLNDILLPNLQGWNNEKIESIFPLDITNRILKVPLFEI